MPSQPQPQQPQPGPGRRGALLAGLGLLAGGALLPRAAAAAEAGGGEQPGRGALETYIDQEAKGKLRDARSLEAFRARYGVRRGLDGRVQLRSRKGEWFSVRLDMEVAGALLLRAPNGDVFAIETQGLPQVDLSDDYVVLMLFADGGWQDAMQAVEYEDADSPGKVVALNMGDAEFREFIGLLKGFEAEEAGGGGKGNGKGGKGKK
ncbi:MAG: hypothetical protein J3K34DRAFT_504507 [Monoraphidium minutum]|nr:MAG: hypothetical protein J3K34DRAFT_504507 [Monoraphidium minutum]